MDNKSLSIVSYITIIGWLVAYFIGKEKADAFLKYHLRQSLGLVLTMFLFSLVVNVLTRLILVLELLNILSFAFLIWIIIGIVNAANQEMKPLPFIGKYFEDKFSFIG